MTANTVPTPRFAAPPRASGHQLTSYDVGDGSRNVTHDDAGRVSSDGTQGFVFDDMGALARVDFAISGGTGTPTPKESYLYDIEGRLVASLLRGGSGEVYVSDGLQMVQSYADGTGALEWNATWGVGLDALISVEKSGTEYFALDDGKGSVVGWVQGTDVVARAEYTPEGRGTYTNVSTGVVCAETGSTRCGGSHLNLPFGFHSALQSRESGLLYFRNRWYSTETQQWLSQDPLDAVDSFDLYAFNAFDAVNNIDPLGLDASEVAGDKRETIISCERKGGWDCRAQNALNEERATIDFEHRSLTGRFLTPDGGRESMRQHKSAASFVTGIGAGFMCAASPGCSGPPDPLLPEFAREHHGGVFIGGLLAAGFGSFEMILGLRGLMNSGAAARTGVGIPLAAIGSAASGVMVVHGALTAIKGGAIAAAGLNAAMAAGKGSGSPKAPSTPKTGGSTPKQPTPAASNPAKPAQQKPLAPSTPPAKPASTTGQQGKVYKVDPSKTPSNKPYVGRTKQESPAKRGSRDGRDRKDAEIVDTYDPNVPGAGRRAEQKAMNNEGGVDALDNKRNEIREENWGPNGIDPPKQ